MKFSKLAVVFISLNFILCFTSCIATKPPVQTGLLVYKSKEYALCKPVSKSSFPDLARTLFGDEKQVWKIEDATDIEAFSSPNLMTIPLKDKNRGGLFEDGYQIIPILCYHKFNSDDNSSMNVEPHVFEQQMKYLKDNGYRVISPRQLLDFLEYRRQIPKKSVLITMDDGYKSVYEVAWPILKKYDFTATLFVYTDYVGISKKAITWDELRVLKANGFTIGSHSVAHSDLTKRNQDETEQDFQDRLKKEIFMSKQIIDSKLGQDTLFFSFPYGRYNADLMNRVKSAGYKIAVTVDRGSNPFFSNPLALKRDMILKQDITFFISRLKIFNPLSLK
jgi:peptidoglycan/xylan/chitin deacetylase (PgdA/CDA1 family)